MAKKIWVKQTNRDRYEGYTEKWQQGVVVGETQLPYANNDSLQQALEGTKLSTRYLVELANGEVVEAWSWDTYEPVNKESK